MTVGPDGARMRAMTSADLPAVLAIENASQPTPWSEGNFRDCLQGAYRCRVAAVDGDYDRKELTALRKIAKAGEVSPKQLSELLDWVSAGWEWFSEASSILV